MTEADFQAAVIAGAKQGGWFVYHNPDSRRSEAGFPDLVLIHPHLGVRFRELKTDRGKLSAAQIGVIAALEAAGADVAVWRPESFREILRELEGGERAPSLPETKTQRERRPKPLIEVFAEYNGPTCSGCGGPVRASTSQLCGPCGRATLARAVGS